MGIRRLYEILNSRTSDSAKLWKFLERPLTRDNTSKHKNGHFSRLLGVTSFGRSNVSSEIIWQPRNIISSTNEIYASFPFKNIHRYFYGGKSNRMPLIIRLNYHSQNNVNNSQNPIMAWFMQVSFSFRDVCVRINMNVSQCSRKGVLDILNISIILLTIRRCFISHLVSFLRLTLWISIGMDQI